MKLGAENWSREGERLAGVGCREIAGEIDTYSVRICRVNIIDGLVFVGADGDSLAGGEIFALLQVRRWVWVVPEQVVWPPFSVPVVPDL